MSKFRAACFTLNNYSEEDVERIKRESSKFTYLVFQRERGVEGGTPHLQGYAYAPNPKSLAGWKTSIGARAHIEAARGSGAQNREYCTKEETREPSTEPWEFGTMPAQGARSDLAAVHQRVVEGATLKAISEESPGDFIRYFRGIQAVQQLYVPSRHWKTTVSWFHGPTGTGKSLEASNRFPDAYWKMGSSKWWDGYEGEGAVIIDDYRRDLCTFAELLRLFDRYPMRVEYKGGTCKFVARHIIVTTPKSPRETWEGRTDEELGQLLRRIEEVRYFPTLFAPSGGDVGSRTGPGVIGDQTGVVGSSLLGNGSEQPGTGGSVQMDAQYPGWDERPVEWQSHPDIIPDEFLVDIDDFLNGLSQS